jgi:pyochelin biosynthetic protein PchC
MYDTWIRAPRRGPRAESRLVCFPHAGGSAGYFRPLALRFDADAPGVDVLAAQHPGRQDRFREPVVTDIGRLADRLTDVLAGRLATPFAF